jgi:hypothetical protein
VTARLALVSLTRRQLLVRTGGIGVGLACLGAVPRALAGPAALEAGRQRTYTAVLRAIDAGPGYEITDVGVRAAMFADAYGSAEDGFRARADALLDALEAFPDGTPFSALEPADANTALGEWSHGEGRKFDLPYLVDLAFPQEDDWHQIGIAPPQ